jgi:SepF-like predicted cell division protein (DUF552 family)
MGFWNKLKKNPPTKNNIPSSAPFQMKVPAKITSQVKSHSTTNVSPKSKSPPVNPASINSVTRKVLIKQLALVKAEDFSMLRQNLLDGNIMVVNMQPLVEGSQDQLSIHNQLNWLKQYCVQSGGSVAKLKENLFLVTPNIHVKVENQFANNN